MDSRFEAYRDIGATPIRASRYTYEIEQLLGDDLDLDPLFLEESWTQGVPAALESLRRRRQWHVERERQTREFRELQSLGSLAYIEMMGCATESLLADRAAKIAGSYDPAWVQAENTEASPRATPQGWNPSRMEAIEQAERFTNAGDGTMTMVRARQMLGVAASSSREQIRSAYRKLVRECHPDQLQLAPSEIREQATRQMAELNEAYRMLCAAQLQIAA
jgi:hypothetical protein